MQRARKTTGSGASLRRLAGRQARTAPRRTWARARRRTQALEQSGLPLPSLRPSTPATSVVAVLLGSSMTCAVVRRKRSTNTHRLEPRRICCIHSLATFRHNITFSTSRASRRPSRCMRSACAPYDRPDGIVRSVRRAQDTRPGRSHVGARCDRAEDARARPARGPATRRTVPRFICSRARHTAPGGPTGAVAYGARARMQPPARHALGATPRTATADALTRASHPAQRDAAAARHAPMRGPAIVRGCALSPRVGRTPSRAARRNVRSTGTRPRN